MKNLEQGFILLITLLIIGIMSTLVLVSMQHLLLYHQVINQQEKQHRNFYQLENVVLQLAHKSLDAVDQACVVHQDLANEVMHRLLHHKGCSLMNELMDYQYIIEDLGEFPCFVALIKGQKKATHHKRISVVQIEKGTFISFLQIRFITSGEMGYCSENEHYIALGVSSWRYFPLA